jgi:hypothetical protein
VRTFTITSFAMWNSPVIDKKIGPLIQRDKPRATGGSIAVEWISSTTHTVYRNYSTTREVTLNVYCLLYKYGLKLYISLRTRFNGFNIYGSALGRIVNISFFFCLKLTHIRRHCNGVNSLVDNSGNSGLTVGVPYKFLGYILFLWIFKSFKRDLYARI